MKKVRFNHGCFSVKQNGNVSNVYVFGGYPGPMKSTEVLNVNDLTWSDGPDLPIGVHGNAGVESNDNQYLGFSVGGTTLVRNGRRRYQHTNTRTKYQYQEHQYQEHNIRYSYKNTIYGLQKSGENEKWIAFKSMNEPRYLASAVNVPSSLLTFC